MVKLLWLSYILLLLFDESLISSLDSLVYSFLLSKRNKKGAAKIHKAQNAKSKFTLAYIEKHTIYPEKFQFWFRFRLITIFSIIPQYAIVIIVNIISSTFVFYLIGFLLIIKFIALYVVRSQFYSPYTSRFDKRHRKFDKSGRNK